MIFFYLYYCGVPPIIRQLTTKLYINFLNIVNEVDKKNITTEEKELIEKIQKYEDKYLEDIRKLNKELIFTEEEDQLREEKKQNCYNSTINKYIEEINEVDNKLTILNEKIKIINTTPVIDEEESLNSSSLQDVDETEFIKLIREETIDNINEEINDLQIHKKIFQNLLDSKENHEKILEKSIETAYNFILSKHLERLQNCFVLETTPHGNVLMIYDTSRGSFKYYSDNTIPYRYLEPVARKYVKQFNCRPLYVDMEEELNLAEEKWEKDEGNIKLKDTIGAISRKQIKKLKEWKDSDPEVTKTTSIKNDKFLLTLNHVCTPIPEVSEKRLIKTIGKEVQID